MTPSAYWENCPKCGDHVPIFTANGYCGRCKITVYPDTKLTAIKPVTTDRIDVLANNYGWTDAERKAVRSAVADILRIQVEQCQQQGEPAADQRDTQRESE